MHSKQIRLTLCATLGLAHCLSIAQLPGVTVHGKTCENSPAKLFLGIPYAEPPINKLRFMPPIPKVDYSYLGGILDATRPPHPCIQWRSIFDVNDPIPSEDCLYLNIYAPPQAEPGSSLPVKVWIHGGGNVGGASTEPLYNACNLATDAIVVTYNYRLGALGYLGLRSAGIQGNMAVQDHLAALGWVKSNIAGFGGDPEKILLFGQSAGADNVWTVSTLPQASTLISGAVAESGGGMVIIPYETAQKTGESFAKELKCDKSDLDCLQSKSVEDLIDAFYNAPALAPIPGKVQRISGINIPGTTSLCSPILDGEIIPYEPLKVGSQVPLLAGSNEADGTVFVVPNYAFSSHPTTAENYTTFLEQWGPVSHTIGQQYPLSRFNSSGSTSKAVMDAITHITTVSGYTCATYRALRAARAAGVPAYAYRFDHTPSCPWLEMFGGPFPGPAIADLFGSAHTGEIPLVFGNLQNQPYGTGTCNANPDEVNISTTIIDAWTAMAEQGDPTTSRQWWPPFDDKHTLGIHITDSMEATTLDFSDCDFWNKIWADISHVDPTTSKWDL